MRVIHVDQPQEGFYKTKLVKGGPWVPVRIWWDYPVDPDTGETLDRSPTMRAERNGEMVDPCEVWNWCAGNPITEQAYRDMRPVSADKAVDFNATDPIF